MIKGSVFLNTDYYLLSVFSIFFYGKINFFLLTKKDLLIFIFRKNVFYLQDKSNNFYLLIDIYNLTLNR